MSIHCLSITMKSEESKKNNMYFEKYSIMELQSRWEKMAMLREVYLSYPFKRTAITCNMN